MNDTKAWAIVSERGIAELASFEDAESAWDFYLAPWSDFRRKGVKAELEGHGYKIQQVVIISAERYAELIALELDRPHDS